jgi:adenine-specific DNA-methyltransferase
MSKKKTKGEVFTPDSVVKFILNKTYNPTNMDYVLEPGCGDGAFLISILEMLIKCFCDNFEIINEKLPKIYGVEIDEQNYSKVIENVEIFLSKFPKIKSRPTIILGDALLDLPSDIKWDYICGNPPYVRIHNLDPQYLKHLQKKYHYLETGMVDLYYAFFELHKNLSPDGVLCFITPNSYLYNSSGESLFSDLYSNRKIQEIYDFGSEKMFIDASTYTCITILRPNSDNIKIKKINKDFEIQDTSIFDYGKNEMKFTSLIQKSKENSKKFKDVYKLKTGFATLMDNFFVITEFEDLGDTIVFQKNGVQYEIEKTITKLCVKASKYEGDFHRVLFPYVNQNEKNIPMTEEFLSENFPLAYIYFNDYRVKLLQRDKGKIEKTKWFLWGRTQGINNTNGKKIIVSPMFLNSPFKFVDEDVLVYSGYYIISNTLPDSFLNQSLLDTLKQISKPMAQGWYGLQKKILDDLNI